MTIQIFYLRNSIFYFLLFVFLVPSYHLLNNDTTSMISFVTAVNDIDNADHIYHDDHTKTTNNNNDMNDDKQQKSKEKEKERNTNTQTQNNHDDSSRQTHNEKKKKPLPNIIIFFADNLAYDDVSFFQTTSMMDSTSNEKQKTQYEEIKKGTNSVNVNEDDNRNNLMDKTKTTTTTNTKKTKKNTKNSIITTPNIDTMIGNNGLKFLHWNSASHLCSSSRSNLLTGQYAIRNGIYPGVFEPDASNGLPYNNNTAKTLATLLKQSKYNYTTSIIGKWHLGHTYNYLPTVHHGFDEYIGIPYHMSGGSIDNEHICYYDNNQTMWLPLYNNTTIIQQPVHIEQLAQTYVNSSINFINNAIYNKKQPFFLYMSFSHVHQLCAMKNNNNNNQSQSRQCQWSKNMGINHNNTNITFIDAVHEMDWIIGEILSNTIDKYNDDSIKNNTIILFTSDNGPWIAEQNCSGSKGIFQGKWLANRVPLNCTACPSGYKHNPTLNQPRRCTLLSTTTTTTKSEDVTYRNDPPVTITNMYQQLLSIHEDDSSYISDIDYHDDDVNDDVVDDDENLISSLDGIHCGEDSGLGSIWEANLRMPALIRWDGKIKPGSITNATVSTLDVVPTILSILDETIYYNNDVVDDNKSNNHHSHRRIDNVNCPIEDKNDSHSDMRYKHETNDNAMNDLRFDGIDISHALFHPIQNNHSSCKNTTTNHTTSKSIDRLLFFWRDGFDDGPLGPPYGRYDVVAVKVIQEQYYYHQDNDNIIVHSGPYNHYKLWFYTKSAHLNNDSHIYHDPPLIFQIDIDPAEEYPIEIDINDIQLQQLISNVKIGIEEHKKSIKWTYPLTIERDPMNIPCVNRESKCRTTTTFTSAATTIINAN